MATEVCGRQVNERDAGGAQPPTYSRRMLLQRAAVVGALGIGFFGSVACGEPPVRDEADSDNAQAAAQPPSAGQSSCAEAELSPQQMAARRALAYVDQSPEPARLCRGCQLFIAPTDDATCGGCQAVGGPIAPGGHCSAWAARV